MSRAPIPGQTKTRLSPPLSPEAACTLHVACLDDLLAEGRTWRAERALRAAAPVNLHLFITPPGSQAAFRQAGVAWPTDYALHNQQGQTLGHRMADAIHRVRNRGPQPAGVLVVGTDLPLLGTAHLESAAGALDGSDVVFGPSLDGGYYLVGVRRNPAGLFDLPAWGGQTVLQRSLALARDLGLSTALLETLPDADTVDDLAAVMRHPLASRMAGRKSLRLIGEHLAGLGQAPPTPPS